MDKVPPAGNFKNKIFSVIRSLDNGLDASIARVHRDGLNLREIGFLSLLGAILYSYFLTNFSFSIDDEFAALRHDPAVWVGQDRWLVYLVEKWILPQPAVPFAPYMILIVLLAVSYALLLRAHGVQTSWKTYFAYPVFGAFPMWWLITAFHANTAALAIGVFFISLSAYMLFGESRGLASPLRGALRKHSMIIIMLACAIAAYQSLLLLFICFAFGSLLTRNLHNQGANQNPCTTILKLLLNVSLLVLLALVLYVAMNAVAQHLIAADSGYIAHFVNPGIFESLFKVLRLVWKEQIALYSGHANRYGANLGINGVVIGLATLVVLRAGRRQIAVNVVLWLGVLIAPFALHFVSGGEPLPLRTLIVLAYVSWLSCMLLLSARHTSLMAASAIIIALLQIKIFGLTSQYMATAAIVQSHDSLLAADIYRRIGELSGSFDRNAPLKMDIYGSKSINTIYAKANTGSLQGSFFSWDNGNILRMVSFMKVMGYENISIPNNNERIALTPIFKQMPVWPAAGSVKKCGDIYLIRLSREPDPTHAKFKESV
jgi:hypothetical protein